MQTTPRVAAAVLLLMLPLSACHRGGGSGGSDGGYGMLSGGDVQQDTTVHFGALDTAMLTNGSGWVRTKPGVMPPNMQPQQLQAPVPDTSMPDSLARDTTRFPRDSMRPPRDSLRRRVRPDSTRPDSSPPDTSATQPDSAIDQDDLR